MYILKNALVSITRNKGRNLLIGIIVVVIGCAAAVTLAIRSSASSLISSYESQYEVIATIGVNRESMRGEMKMKGDMSEDDREAQKENMIDIFSSISDITVEDIDTYGDSKYVTDYYYQVSVGVNSNNLEPASMNSDNGEEGFEPGGMPRGNQDFKNMASSDFTLIGYSTLTAMEDFISGKYSITDGEISSDLESNSCVINSELATLNDLEVGDTIILIDPDDESNTITLTITGIFDEVSESSDVMGMFTSSANTIITNIKVVDNLTSSNTDMRKTVTPSFVLISKDVIESFNDELYSKGMSEYLSVSTNLDQVESATSTISNVNTFAIVFLVITLIIGGIVLFVINMINIRERKYEIGVLRTIGMKKSYLTLQFISELLIVSFIALLIGAGIGATISVPVSNYLLKNEISSSQNQKNEISNNFGKRPGDDRFDKINGVATVQAFDSIDAVVNIKVLLQLLGIGVALTLISSSASMISIQKFSPLTILKERS